LSLPFANILLPIPPQLRQNFPETVTGFFFVGKDIPGHVKDIFPKLRVAAQQRRTLVPYDRFDFFLIHHLTTPPSTPTCQARAAPRERRHRSAAPCKGGIYCVDIWANENLDNIQYGIGFFMGMSCLKGIDFSFAPTSDPLVNIRSKTV
jgi:hypothetical protein